MPNYARIISLLLLASAAPGCAQADSHWVELGGKRFAVEIADDFDERARGLMFRDSLAADRGMLFVYDQEQPAAFWMKNTKIPLDILYFDQHLKLVTLQRRVPPCSLGDQCPAYPSEHPAMYVLEVNAGQADQLGLKEGDALLLGSDVPKSGQP